MNLGNLTTTYLPCDESTHLYDLTFLVFVRLIFTSEVVFYFVKYYCILLFHRSSIDAFYGTEASLCLQA